MDKPSAEQVKLWLEVLLDARMNREPEEFYQEQVFIRHRRESFPEYSTATMQWWRHADDYWSEIQPLAVKLFCQENSWNFVQWVLELVRQLWPDHYTLKATSYDAELDLIDSLCDGSTSPIHIAAMLGLGNMFDYLTAQGVTFRRPGYLGTPTLCALAGPGAAVMFQSPPSWKLPLTTPCYASQSRMHILNELNGVENANYAHRWKRHVLPDLSSLAFASSLAMKSSNVFQDTLGNIVSIASLIELFNAPSEMLKLEPDRAMLSEIVTLAVDFSISPNMDLPSHLDLRNAMAGFMAEAHLSFKSCEMYRIENEEFSAVANEIIIEEEDILLERLVLDPRFHITMPSAMGEDDGTILHMAVSGDSLKAVDVFMRSGGNCDARDGEGRTPLMVSESTAMLSLLMDKYHVSTTGTDHFGRNIWHYAVATNEVSMIAWLSANDPEAQRNLRAKTIELMTPFDKALVRTLEYWPISDRSDFRSLKCSALAVLKCLVDNKAELSLSVLGTPTAHLLASWGDAGIVDEMQRRGIDFLVLDKNKRSALHYVNSLATGDMIRRLRRLCGTLPVMDADMKTPAETVLLSSTHHETDIKEPVCRSRRAYAWLARQASFTFESYLALLTPEVLSSRDDRGRGLWQRVCEDIVPVICISCVNFADAAGVACRDCDLGTSISAAIKCLVRSRTARDYERETGNPAALCLLETIKPTSFGWLIRHQLHYFVIENSDAKLIHNLYESSFASDLLLCALTMEDDDFVEFLIRHKVKLDVMVSGETGSVSLFHRVVSSDDIGTSVRSAVKYSSLLERYPLHDTLRALVRSSSMSVAIHKLGIMCEHGLLTKYSDDDAVSKGILTRLYHSAKSLEHTKVMKYLEEHGFSPDSV